MIETIPIDKKWKSDLKKRGFTSDSIYDEGQHEDLKTLLLFHGGEAVVLPKIEEDKEAIMSRFMLIADNEHETFPRTLKKGATCHCHQNSADNYCKYGFGIMTGYALSADGVWRQHTWNVADGGTVVETTEPRVAYLGFLLTTAECLQFCEDNLY